MFISTPPRKEVNKVKSDDSLGFGILIIGIDCRQFCNVKRKGGKDEKKYDFEFNCSICFKY